MTGMLVNTFLPSDCNSASLLDTHLFSASNNYTLTSRGKSPSYEPNKNILTGHYLSSVETTFEADVIRFFEKLSANQESLGHEFEHVLFENLWDLYQN